MNEDEFTKNVEEHETIDYAELETRPEFYESVSNNPIKSILDAKKDVYADLLRLKQVKKVEVKIDGTLDPVTMKSTKYIEETHNVQSGIPFVFSKIGIFGEGASSSDIVIIPEPKVTQDGFYLTIENQSARDYEVDIVFYIYEILERS